MSGGREEDIAKTIRVAIGSSRAPTPKAATASSPKLAAIAVMMPAARGVIIFAPAAGTPMRSISRPDESMVGRLGSEPLTSSF